MMTIKTITVDTYPIRYAAGENHGVWVESTHSLAGSPGHETANFHEPTSNPAHDNDGSGIYVSIVNHAGRFDRKRGPLYVARCDAYGPNQYRRQNLASFESFDYSEVKRLASAWINEVARPWIVTELANQIDYVEVIDAHGNTHPGELYGVNAGGDHPWGTSVKLDNPDAFEGRGVRGGVVWIDKTRVRMVTRASA